MCRQRLVAVAVAAVVSTALADGSWGDTFGTDANRFDIEFVGIGNPGNPADATGSPNPVGSVPYTYRMGKFEISNQMIDKANIMGGLGISRLAFFGPDAPALSISWNEAARFVNWLNTSTGSPPAYKFASQPGEPGYDPNAEIELWSAGDAGHDASNRYRNRLARYFLPSVDEWYKAAYYDPTSGVYYDYPTGSNSVPASVASGTAAGTAVYNQTFEAGPANVMLAGGLSPYGTMAQGGNAYEWEETAYDLMNDAGSSARGVRGGDWLGVSGALSSSDRSFGILPANENFLIGFRVASVIPEPGTMLPGALAGMALLWRRRSA